ncbi:hypothetical protein [Lactobacillus plantarum JDM1] [Lactiplantibacillus mudanjiangensis]|uniref:hypothetical protein n=1 Tax=Lactiplantibacillus mudanjiangensis TaxID=1296538 RepID=UPI00101462A5|nr:hypothetical protein [Lactobacillus plantarum JDM1] [Lactiplantibacillus mudanjiangensis]
MHNYKSKAEHWHRKLLRTKASWVGLCTYRFNQWQKYEELARKEAMDHLRGAEHENVQ